MNTNQPMKEKGENLSIRRRKSRSLKRKKRNCTRHENHPPATHCSCCWKHLPLPHILLLQLICRPMVAKWWITNPFTTGAQLQAPVWEIRGGTIPPSKLRQCIDNREKKMSELSQILQSLRRSHLIGTSDSGSLSHCLHQKVHQQWQQKKWKNKCWSWSRPLLEKRRGHSGDGRYRLGMGWHQFFVTFKITKSKWWTRGTDGHAIYPHCHRPVYTVFCLGDTDVKENLYITYLFHSRHFDLSQDVSTQSLYFILKCMIHATFW